MNGEYLKTTDNDNADGADGDPTIQWLIEMLLHHSHNNFFNIFRFQIFIYSKKT